MPELPEVETIVRDLRPRLIGQVLKAPRLYKTDVLYRVRPAQLLRALAGRRVVEVTRRAKHAVLRLNSGHRLVIQPGMTGALLIYRRPLTEEERRYAVLTAQLSRNGTFVYRDVRRLGTILLVDEAGWRAYTSRIGPEPLDPEFDAGRLAAVLASTRQAVKKAIMDQRLLAGVGNIYANEALFRARIDPSKPADRVEARAVSRLFRAIQTVLREALKAHGTTLRDYRTATGGRGSYQFRLRVYGRGGSPCPRCRRKARLATTHAIDGRATTFCWRCQR